MIHLKDGTHLHGGIRGAEDAKWQHLHLQVVLCRLLLYDLPNGQWAIGSWKLSLTFGKGALTAAGTRSAHLSSRCASSGKSAESVDSMMSSQSSGVGLMLGTKVGMLHWSWTSRRPTLTSEARVEGRVHGGMILSRQRGKGINHQTADLSLQRVTSNNVARVIRHGQFLFFEKGRGRVPSEGLRGQV
jgi:hypothetical protein